MSAGLKVFKLLLSLCLLGGAISLVRTTVAEGRDFLVFWQTAVNGLAGIPLYSHPAGDPMAFKYPPWLLPFLLPFGFLPLVGAKWVWGFLEIFCLGFIFRWIRRELSIPFIILVPVALMFWSLWIIHAYDGQIVLMMLAGALGLRPQNYQLPRRALLGLTWVLSTKVFTVFPLWHLNFRKLRLAAVLWVGLGFMVFSLPALVNEPGHSPLSLVSHWVESAGSAGRLFSWDEVRGRRNQGLPGYTLKQLGVAPDRLGADILMALFYCLFFGAGWKKISRAYPETIRWIGFLALVPVVHPLPWLHLFIFAFPVSVYVFQRLVSWRGRQGSVPIWIGLILAINLLCLSTQNVYGDFGVFLEYNAAKSWGVLLMLAVLIRLESFTNSPRNAKSGYAPRSV